MNRRLMKLLARVMEENKGDDGNKGGGGGGGTPAKEPEAFSREYVKELREENKATRLAKQAAEKERDEHKSAAEKAQQEADGKVKAANTAAEQRIIRSEMKALAIKAGIVDLDGLALADLSKVKFDDKGDLVGADEAIEALKKSKPYLFGAASTSSTKGAPKPGDKEPIDARNMKPEEYAAARAKLTGNRR